MNKPMPQTIAIRVLTDAIIFERVVHGMNKLASTINPNENQPWKASEEYTGLSNAYAVLGYDEGIENEPVTDKFHDIFFEHLNNDLDTTSSQRITPKQLAKQIFTDWLSTIKRYDLLKELQAYSLN